MRFDPRPNDRQHFKRRAHCLRTKRSILRPIRSPSGNSVGPRSAAGAYGRYHRGVQMLNHPLSPSSVPTASAVPAIPSCVGSIRIGVFTRFARPIRRVGCRGRHRFRERWPATGTRRRKVRSLRRVWSRISGLLSVGRRQTNNDRRNNKDNSHDFRI
jgi:hypothetical protein